MKSIYLPNIVSTINMHELELILREPLFPSWILYILIGSLLIVTITKTQKITIFNQIRLAFLNPLSSVHFSKGEFRFFSVTNALLLFNYFIVTGTVFYMFRIYYDINQLSIIFIPLLYYILQTLSLAVASLISGESNRISELFSILNLFNYITGLIIIPLVIVWILNPQHSVPFIYIITGVLLFTQFLRLTRSILVSIRNNINWYYIILYLCTFEIGVAYIIYMLLYTYFIGV